MFNSLPQNDIQLVLSNHRNYKVLMFQTGDQATMQRSIGIMIQSPSGNLSSPIYLKRSRILNSRNCFDFLYDCEGDFDKEEVDQIRTTVQQKMHDLKAVNCTAKPPLEEVYSELYKYALNHDKDDTVSVSKEHFEIRTEAFEHVLKKLNLGYGRLEVLKFFKVLGIMKANKGRPYDFKLTDANGTCYRVYRFMCPAEIPSASQSVAPEDDMIGGTAA